MIVMNIFGCGLFVLIVDFADLDLNDEEDDDELGSDYGWTSLKITNPIPEPI